MQQRSVRATTAWLRLTVAAAAAITIAALGCRPRWSADGKRVVYGAVDGRRHYVAERDFDSGESRELFDIELNDGALDMVRDPDRERWVIVWADGSDDNAVNVRTRDDLGVEGETHKIRSRNRNVVVMLTEPVVAAGYVFLSGSTIQRVELETGETKELGQRGVLAFPTDQGVGYVSSTTIANSANWEIGRLDPKTLELEPWITRPDGCNWKLMGAPRFDPTGRRCAVVAMQGDARAGLDALKWAILVMEDGNLLATVELDGVRSMGPIAWLDAAHICATTMKPGDDEDVYTLFETNFNGSFTRETEVLRAPIFEKLLNDGGVQYQLKQPLFLQPSPSPDGKTVAFTTAKLQWPNFPEERGGLLLLRRDQKNRVERIAFPSSDK